MSKSDILRRFAKAQGPSGIVRRTAVLGLLTLALPALFVSTAAAETLSCLGVERMKQPEGVQPANKKIGVSVAYLKVPFYANFKTGLADGAKRFGGTPSTTLA